MNLMASRCSNAVGGSWQKKPFVRRVQVWQSSFTSDVHTGGTKLPALLDAIFKKVYAADVFRQYAPLDKLTGKRSGSWLPRRSRQNLGSQGRVTRHSRCSYLSGYPAYTNVAL